MSQARFNNCFVAFVDVLGYKASAEERGSKTYATVEAIARDLVDLEAPDCLGGLGFAVYVFSDNFAITVEKLPGVSEDLQVGLLMTCLARCQLRSLVEHGILLRGCVAYGECYRDLTIQGEALIDAAMGEKDAVYPRITVADSAMARIEACGIESAEGLVVRDSDSVCYVDYIGIAGCGTQDWPSQYLEGVLGCAGVESIEAVGGAIEKLVRNPRFSKYRANMTDSEIATRERVIQKHIWLLEVYNEWCDRWNMTEHQVVFQIKPNRQYGMKQEIEVFDSYLELLLDGVLPKAKALGPVLPQVPSYSPAMGHWRLLFG